MVPEPRTTSRALAALTLAASLLASVALLSVGLSVARMSVSSFPAPTALLLLGAAIAGPRAGVREETLADAPSVRERLLRTAAGFAAVGVGVTLVDAGAFDQHLFGSCARETLACVVETTNWLAVGLTLLGFAAVAIGGWLVWGQVYVSRALRAARAS